MVVRYAGAFMVSDVGVIEGLSSEIFTGFLVLTGVGMGILDVVGGGLLFNGWSKTMPRTGDRWSARFKVLTFVVFGLIVSGLFILVPFTVARTSQETITVALGGKGSFFHWTWATMVNIIPYLLIAGVFVGNKLVTSLESEESSGKSVESFQKVSKENGKLPESFQKDWRKLRPMLTSEDVEKLSTIDADGMRALATKHGVSYKTVSNWRQNARKELGK
jgi:hypothetical protein